MLLRINDYDETDKGFIMVKTLLLFFGLMFSAYAYAAPVNVNKASAEEMSSALTGVGQAKAKAIVAYRRAHGRFESVNDLIHVKGIGSKTLAKNEQDILLSDPKK